MNPKNTTHGYLLAQDGEIIGELSEISEVDLTPDDEPEGRIGYWLPQEVEFTVMFPKRTLKKIFPRYMYTMSRRPRMKKRAIERRKRKINRSQHDNF